MIFLVGTMVSIYLNTNENNEKKLLRLYSRISKYLMLKLSLQLNI